jgi:hypothetical protein
VKAFFLLWGAAALFSGCVSELRIADQTKGRPAICDVHDVAMTQKRVEMTYGMKRDPWNLALWKARHDLFPHADEIYDTGACLPSYEKYATVYVCSQCPKARSKWLQANPTFLRAGPIAGYGCAPTAFAGGARRKYFKFQMISNLRSGFLNASTKRVARSAL